MPSKYRYESNKIARREYNKKYYAKTRDARYSGLPWLSWEIDIIMSHDVSDTELSAVLYRSVKAIQVKRSKILKARSYENKQRRI